MPVSAAEPARAFELSAADREQLRERGVSAEEALRQAGLAARQPFPFNLVRPCTVGDGIEAPEPGPGEAVAAARAAGRFSAFIPAAGAATRMFEALLAGSSPAMNAFAEGLAGFAFYDALREHLARKGEDVSALLAPARRPELLLALLGPEGLGYADLPKGLLPFHKGGDGPRTAFEEVLLEAAPLTRDGAGRSRVHVVVSPAHLERFRAYSKTCLPRCEKLASAKFKLELSVQKPRTDNLALDGHGGPLRDAQGRLVFRPAGHGALLENLSECGGDLVFIQNVDNVAVDRLKGESRAWKNALASRLLALQAALHAHLNELEAAEPAAAVLEAAERFASRSLGLELPADWAGLGPAARKAWLLDALDRPLRVCGVVQNQGEPGGAPFWVRDRSGRLSRQLVEKGQVDFGREDQAEVFRAATHFNPVNMVCALKDPKGRPYELKKLVDPEAVIVTAKYNDGRHVVAVELPGLWNGSMAGWNTIFAEVPVTTFHPVKTVLDLLREGHQA